MRLFSPNNGDYEYSAVVTDNKNWNPKELLLFVSSRSAHKNSISELKTSFAFDHIPTNTYQANSSSSCSFFSFSRRISTSISFFNSLMCLSKSRSTLRKGFLMPFLCCEKYPFSPCYCQTNLSRMKAKILHKLTNHGRKDSFVKE